jgi:hypothetical protein
LKEHKCCRRALPQGLGQFRPPIGLVLQLRQGSGAENRGCQTLKEIALALGGDSDRPALDLDPGQGAVASEQGQHPGPHQGGLAAAAGSQD